MIIIYIRKQLLLNSMKIKNCILFLSILITIHSLNLVADSGFQSFNMSLTQTFLGTQSYAYRILLNGQSNWYSTISGGILVRESTSLNTTVIDSVNNNSNEKICQDFNMTDSKPYQLSFDSFIDSNIGWALLGLQFNGITLFYGHIINKIPITKTYTVFLKQNVNVLCFEGWASASESSKIGALIDNVVLAPFDVRYIHFQPFPSPTQINIIYLVSNETVINENEQTIFKSELKLQIPNLQFNVIQIDTNQNSNLIIAIEIKNQYASSQTQPTIMLPSHRNPEGQIILYYTSASILPRYLYSSASDNEIVSGSFFYLIILVKIYNVIYRVIKIIGFAFIGIRFLGGFYLLLFLGFLDLEYIMPIVRNAIQEFMTLTINTQTINFFVFLTRHQLLDYGASYLPLAEQFSPRNSSGVEYSRANVTPNLYSLIIDDLFIAIFSTLKIVVFYHLIFKGSKKFMKIFKRVKNQKILLQYITIFSVIILAAGICWRGERLINFYGKINRAVSFLIPIVSTFLCLTIFINEHNNMIIEYRKARRGKKKSEANEKIRKYYQSQIVVSLVENLMFIIVPALVGLGYVYLSLSIYLWMILLKLKFMTKGLSSKHKLINFFWFISYLVEFSLVAFFMMAKLLESFTDLSSSSEITWMIILKYNSLGLVFMYVAVGFIETVCSIINFVQGLMSLEYSCPIQTNKIQNEFNQNQIKVEEITHSQLQETTGIKVLNQLKQKVQGAPKSISSTQKIPNPFIKSSESISIEISQKNSIKEAQLSKQSKKQAERIKTNVISMKNIGKEELTLTPIKSERPKSALQQENYQRSKKQKKPMKQKSLKLIKKLQISYAKQQQPLQEPQTLKHMVVSNFEKQENFS